MHDVWMLDFTKDRKAGKGLLKGSGDNTATILNKNSQRLEKIAGKIILNLKTDPR